MKRKLTSSKRTKKRTNEPGDGGEIVIRKATDAKEKPRNWLIYGISGTGKTTLAASFPKPALLVDITDEGDESVEDIEGLDVYEVTEAEDLERLYWHLAKNKGKYKTIILDTISQMMPLIVADVAKKSKKKIAGKKAGDWGTMNQKQWGQVSDKGRDILNKFRSLGVHFVMLAQQKMTEHDTEQDDIDDVLLPEVGPAVMKSVATHACAVASFIGNTFIRNVKSKKELRKKSVPTYCLRVGPNPVYLTKVRKPVSIEVPDHIRNPTFEKLINLKKGIATNGKEVEKGKRRSEGSKPEGRRRK